MIPTIKPAQQLVSPKIDHLQMAPNKER
jgi:hypothetical protein